MEFKILPIIAFLSVAIVVSHAALPSEEYWNSVLPNTPMPKAVKDLLQPTPAKISQFKTLNDPNGAVFFLERDLFVGNKMNLRFSQSTKNQQTFLPRQLADSIPFSSEKLPAIFSKLDMKPASAEAAAIEKTIQMCEGGAAVKGEEKLCATSLESMIDFSTAVLGKEVTAVSTEADGGGGERKAYRVAAVKRLTAAEAATVVCHQQEYAYPVFYCHKADDAVAYRVSLVGGGGAKAEAVAACHRDTAELKADPKNFAFQMFEGEGGEWSDVPLFAGESYCVGFQKIINYYIYGAIYLCV